VFASDPSISAFIARTRWSSVLGFDHILERCAFAIACADSRPDQLDALV
jgi:hypothetical protein